MKPADTFIRRSTRLGDVGSKANWGQTAREFPGLSQDDLSRSSAVDRIIGRLCAAVMLFVMGYLLGAM